MMFFARPAGAALAALLATTARMPDAGSTPATCPSSANDFPAIQAVAGAAEACAGDGVTVTKNLTTEHESLDIPGLTADPAQYSVAIIATSSVVPIMSAGLARPLDGWWRNTARTFVPSSSSRSTAR